MRFVLPVFKAFNQRGGGSGFEMDALPPPPPYPGRSAAGCVLMKQSWFGIGSCLAFVSAVTLAVIAWLAVIALKLAQPSHMDMSGVAIVQCSVHGDTTSRNTAVAQVSNCRIAPLGDQPRQESRVGDTGNHGSRHLAPVELRGGSSKTRPCVHKQGAPCSNKGFLLMSTADYLSLLDWTARQTHSSKGGSTPKQSAPLFDRLGISAEIWCRLVKDFGRLFSVVAGHPRRIDEHRSRDISRRYRTRQKTRELLAMV